MAFRIDITGALKDLAIPRERAQEVVESVVKHTSWAVYDRIHEEASLALKSTRGIYKRNIQIPEFKAGGKGAMSSITLTGKLPNMVEQGTSAYDLKDGFARSDKRKHKLDGGWYMSIPFRHATPDSIGESEAFSGVMSKRVYEEIKKKAANATTVSWDGDGNVRRGTGLTMKSLYGNDAKKGERGVIPQERMGNLSAAQAKPYEHSSPIALGMTRNEKTYEKATQSTYMTFRTVSDMSPANSWIHKGFVAKDLMLKAAQHPSVMKRLTEVIEMETKSMGL